MELRVTSKETAKRWAMPIKCLRSPTDSVLTTEAPPGFASHAKINEKDTEKTHDKDKDDEPVVPTRAYYEPSNIGQLSPQMFCWKGTWMTVTYTPGHIDWQPDKEVGGSLTLRWHPTLALRSTVVY